MKAYIPSFTDDKGNIVEGHYGCHDCLDEDIDAFNGILEHLVAIRALFDPRRHDAPISEYVRHLRELRALDPQLGFLTCPRGEATRAHGRAMALFAKVASGQGIRIMDPRQQNP